MPRHERAHRVSKIPPNGEGLAKSLKRRDLSLSSDLTGGVGRDTLAL
jgi:hypothetical protein